MSTKQIAKIVDGVVVNIASLEDGDELIEGYVDIPDDVGIGFTEDRDGNGVLTGHSPPPKPDALPLPPPTTWLCIAATRQMLEDKARELKYDSMLAAVTYAEESTVSKYQTEGRALRAWRSNVWEKCYEIVADIDGSVRSQPTVADFLTELPTYA